MCLLSVLFQSFDGQQVDLNNFPSLEVTIELTPLTRPAGARIPVEGKTKFYNDVTHGRVGGHNGIYDNL